MTDKTSTVFEHPYGGLTYETLMSAAQKIRDSNPIVRFNRNCTL